MEEGNEEISKSRLVGEKVCSHRSHLVTKSARAERQVELNESPYQPGQGRGAGAWKMPPPLRRLEEC